MRYMSGGVLCSMLPLKLFHPRVARPPNTSPLRVFVHALYCHSRSPHTLESHEHSSLCAPVA